MTETRKKKKRKEKKKSHRLQKVQVATSAAILRADGVQPCRATVVWPCAGGSWDR